MRYAALLAVVIVVGFWATTAAPTGVAGTGGHGGSGGHGSGHGSAGHGGGHVSHGSFSGNAAGHSVGHSIGHSITHFFGHHGKRVSSAPPAATLAATERNPIERPGLNPVPQPRLRPQHGRPQGQAVVVFFPHRRHFGFGGCPVLGFPGNGFFFGNAFNCFDDVFFFDPFFWKFSGSFSYGPPSWSESGAGLVDSTAEPVPGSGTEEKNGLDTDKNQVGAENGETSGPNGERRVTLLELRDGSMYGLTNYWVEENQLHYFTTYGGQDAVPLERIDFGKTVKLNADRGVEFVLRSKPAQR